MAPTARPGRASEHAQGCCALSASPGSLVAGLLSATLTIYHLVCLAQQQWPLLVCLHPGQRLQIDLLGPQRELDEWPLLLELASLWPALHIHLTLVGPNVPHSLDRQQMVTAGSSAGQQDQPTGSITISFLKAHWHQLRRRPDLVLGLNAGLAAYPSWVLTVQALSESRTPALFTDFCEEAAVRAEAMLSSAQGSMQALPCTCNPFQSPVSCMGRDNRLPSFPNAFLLGAGPAMLSREAFA